VAWGTTFVSVAVAEGLGVKVNVAVKTMGSVLVRVRLAEGVAVGVSVVSTEAGVWVSIGSCCALSGVALPCNAPPEFDPLPISSTVSPKDDLGSSTSTS
jgi:hypothetical protein